MVVMVVVGRLDLVLGLGAVLCNGLVAYRSETVLQRRMMLVT